MLAIPTSIFAKRDGMARFSGKIVGYNQGNNVIIVDPQGNIPDDTLQLKNDGSFNTAVKVDGPTELIFSIEQPQVSFKIYATQNSSAKMTIVPRQVKDNEYVADVNYDGDNKEVFSYIQTYDFNNIISEKFSDESIKKMGFAKFRDSLRNELFELKKTLALLKDKVFKVSKEAEWEKKYVYELLRYVPFEEKEDKEFTLWFNSIDYNADENIAISYVARSYHLASMSGNNNYDVDFIKDLPRIFSNKESYYAAADAHIVNVMAKAPVNTDQIYSTYKKLYAGHESDIPDYVKESYEEAKRNVAGKSAPDFEMEDVNGNKIKLSDLKGKTIYIDVWATWCGPCKIEIPNMFNLAEHYKDDNTVFLVSISIDQDTDRWKNTMNLIENKPSNWGQYHVIGALDSDFCKRYNIVGIPRFMLIDRDGKVVSLDAPRPGQPETISLIDQQ